MLILVLPLYIYPYHYFIISFYSIFHYLDIILLFYNPLFRHSGARRLSPRWTGWEAPSRTKPSPSRTVVVAQIGAKIKPRSSVFSEEQNSRDICVHQKTYFLLLLLVLAEASAKCNLMSEAYYLAPFSKNTAHSSPIADAERSGQTHLLRKILSHTLSLARLLTHTLCVWYKAVCMIKVIIGNLPILLISTQC